VAQEIKFTKTHLRDQQVKLAQLQKYLPTLQLKKALLQMEVNEAIREIEERQKEFTIQKQRTVPLEPLLSDKNVVDLLSSVRIATLEKHYENSAGIDIPYLDGIIFEPTNYSLFDTPVWLETGIKIIQDLIIAGEKLKTTEEKKRLLQKELKEVSIRVNLFEKILIPRCLDHIKKIKIFLSDQQLAAISQAKVAKKKIQDRANA
jgi:V/A-type H+/Na+-transporting ATPase subunit D